MTTAQPPLGVGRTALGVARIRAEETCQPDPLFTDPYAQLFLDAAPGLLPDAGTGSTTGPLDTSRAAHDSRQPSDWQGLAQVGTVFSFHGIIRTRFFDDYLTGAAATGTRQVVLLAAGLDTRAFRLDWPDDVQLFEIDHSDVIAFKEHVLDVAEAQPRCHRHVASADLSRDWSAPLLAAGLDPGQKTAWLAEGLLIYLSHTEVERLLTTITTLSLTGSTLALESGGIATAQFMQRARRLPAMASFNALQKGGLETDNADWLNTHGWSAVVHDGAATLPANTNAASLTKQPARSSSLPEPRTRRRSQLQRH